MRHTDVPVQVRLKQPTGIERALLGDIRVGVLLSPADWKRPELSSWRVQGTPHATPRTAPSMLLPSPLCSQAQGLLPAQVSQNWTPPLHP